MSMLATFGAGLLCGAGAVLMLALCAAGSQREKANMEAFREYQDAESKEGES